MGIIIKVDSYLPQNEISVPEYIFEKMYNNSDNKLKVGMLEKEVVCGQNEESNVVRISRYLYDYFSLTDGQKTNLTIKDNKICIGPVIGIFTSIGALKKAIVQNPSFRFVEQARANREADTIMYFFSIKDVDFINHKITGTYYDENQNIWNQKSFPFPDVLYDRGGGALKSQQPISQYIREQLSIYKDLRKINSRYFFDKWDVYETLSRHEDMQQYLPYTMLYRKREDLIYMFEKYSVIYIKNCFGSNGRGVVRVIKNSNGNYMLSYFNNDVMERQIESINDLSEQISRIYGNQKVILQSAIDVIKINERNIDMRATVQRNGEGELGVYAYPVRLGREKCPITSTKSGSTVYIFDEFFKKYLNYNSEQIRRLKTKINEMLIKSFEYIETAYGDFGELGIDFAVDKEGYIWFIECNAKPGKDALFLSYDKDTIKRAFLNPLEYAKFITKFTNN